MALSIMLYAHIVLAPHVATSLSFPGGGPSFHLESVVHRHARRGTLMEMLPKKNQHRGEGSTIDGRTLQNESIECDNSMSVEESNQALSTQAVVSLDMTPSSQSPELHLSEGLVSKLDLNPLLTHVASYASTKRGKDSILALIPNTSSSASFLYAKKKGRKPPLFGNRSQRKSRGNWYPGDGLLTSNVNKNPKFSTILIAQSANEATMEYELVRQAMEVLQSQSSSFRSIPLPPMFKLRDRNESFGKTASTSSNVETDDDEWIDICLNPSLNTVEDIDLEMILQAEQVTRLLLNTYEWATNEKVSKAVSSLSNIIVEAMNCSSVEGQETGVSENTVASSLSQLYQALNGTVEIVRGGPSLYDLNNQFSYQFRLATGNGRFGELDALRKKEEEYVERLNKGGVGSKEKQNVHKLAMIREEISAVETQIQRTLIAAMVRAAPSVQVAFNALARLDSIFARASFGCDWNGVIPEVTEKGRVNVEAFVHPVLAIEKRFETEVGQNSNAKTVVPIDLMMPGKGSYQALMISGPNSGGKTLSLKSFGLAATMAKLALPIPVARLSKENPTVVDFFRDIDVEVGDNQSLSSGESTLMARLNSLSALIEKSSEAPFASGSFARLVLLDELGGGTDPIAGAAIAQSILEKMLSSDSNCKIVATTHSPELKSLSLTDHRFQCASVMLDSQTCNDTNGSEASVLSKYSKKPTYQLRYGTTGESYALGAATRCRPPLPDDVIQRAAQLMDNGDSQEILRKHLLALDRERSATKVAREKAEKVLTELNYQKDDTIAKLQSSDIYLSRIESRLEAIFETLRNDQSGNAFELVGESLGDIRLMRRKIKSEEELLAEKGMRRVPESYSFFVGESVVIIAEGEFKGYNAVVKAVDSGGTVIVVPTLDLFSTDEEGSSFMELKRSEVAIWDYPNEFGEKITEDFSLSKASRLGSNNKVLSLLSSLNDDNNKSPKYKAQHDKASDSFTSSRQRKAARKGKKKK